MTDSITFRTGRKVGRTIYQQVGPKPSDDDVLVGVMDTPELAATFVDAVNRTAPPSADVSSEPIPLCDCGHRYDRHRHAPPARCYECDSENCFE